MVTNEAVLTWVDFEAYAEQYPDKLLELIGGKITEKVTSEQRGLIVANIGGELRSWKQQNCTRGIYAASVCYRIPSDRYNLRCLDVIFRFTGDAPSDKIIEAMPEFCVEVKSRSNTYDELREKAKFYIANGAKLVWLVYPAKRIVEAYTSEGSELFTENETLTSDVLPNFELAVADIFEV